MKKILIHSAKHTYKALIIASSMFLTITSCTDKPKTDETQIDTLAITPIDSPKVVGSGNGTVKQDTIPAKIDAPVIAEVIKPIDKPKEPKIDKPKEPKVDKVENIKLPKDIVENPDQPSSPTGGYPTFYKFVRENLKYPELAIKDGVEGSVRLQFVVSKDGSISHIKVIAGIGSGCDEEAMRIVKQSPKWQPAVDKGNNVTSKASIPISFKLK